MKEIAYKGVALQKEEEEWHKKKERSQGSATAPTIRTYNADVEEVLRERKTTKTDIIMAEAAKRESAGEARFPAADGTSDEGSHLSVGKVILILGLLLAFIGGIGAYVLLGLGTESVDNGPSPIADQPRPSPVGGVAKSSAKIVLSSSPRAQIMADITIAFQNTSLLPGEYRAVDFAINTPGVDEHTANTNEFLSAVLYQRPREALLRSLESDYSYRIYGGMTPAGVLTFTSKQYELTFSEMLAWEPNLPDDLAPILNPASVAILAQARYGAEWSDAIISGVDARVFTTQGGSTLLSYTIIGKDRLIIAGSEDALRAAIAEENPTGE